MSDNTTKYDDDNTPIQITFTRGELEQISSGIQDLNDNLLHNTYDEQKHDEDKVTILQIALNNLKVKMKCDHAILQHYPNNSGKPNITPVPSVGNSIMNIMSHSYFGGWVKSHQPAQAVTSDGVSADLAMEIQFDTALRDEDQLIITDLIKQPNVGDWRDSQTLWVWPNDTIMNMWLDSIKVM